MKKAKELTEVQRLKARVKELEAEEKQQVEIADVFAEQNLRQELEIERLKKIQGNIRTDLDYWKKEARGLELVNAYHKGQIDTYRKQLEIKKKEGENNGD